MRRSADGPELVRAQRKLGSSTGRPRKCFRRRLAGVVAHTRVEQGRPWLAVLAAGAGAGVAEEEAVARA